MFPAEQLMKTMMEHLHSSKHLSVDQVLEIESTLTLRSLMMILWKMMSHFMLCLKQTRQHT